MNSNPYRCSSCNWLDSHSEECNGINHFYRKVSCRKENCLKIHDFNVVQCCGLKVERSSLANWKHPIGDIVDYEHKCYSVKGCKRLHLELKYDNSMLGYGWCKCNKPNNPTYYIIKECMSHCILLHKICKIHQCCAKFCPNTCYDFAMKIGYTLTMLINVNIFFHQLKPVDSRLIQESMFKINPNLLVFFDKLTDKVKKMLKYSEYSYILNYFKENFTNFMTGTVEYDIGFIYKY